MDGNPRHAAGLGRAPGFETGPGAEPPATLPGRTRPGGSTWLGGSRRQAAAAGSGGEAGRAGAGRPRTQRPAPRAWPQHGRSSQTSSPSSAGAPLSRREPRSPRPGAEWTGGRGAGVATPGFTRRLVQGRIVGPRLHFPGCVPSPLHPLASSRRSAFRTPLASLGQDHGPARPASAFFIPRETTAGFIIMIPTVRRFEFRKQTFLLSHPPFMNSSPKGSSVLFPPD